MRVDGNEDWVCKDKVLNEIMLGKESTKTGDSIAKFIPFLNREI